MSDKLGWGILAAGGIARSFATGVLGSKTGRLVAVGSRSQEKAEAFAEEFNVPHRHGSYEALLADPDVQAVYIATPHPMHVEWAIKAAEARKHILVEKPIALNFAQAMEVVEAARANDVFLMEAFMYRCHPQTARIVELIRSKVIGDLRVIQTAFSFHWPRPFVPDSRLTSNAMGGGGILDVGGYTVSMARLLAGAAAGKPFAEPVEVKGVGHLLTTGVDGYALALLKFPGDVLAECATGVQVSQENVLRVYGSGGWLFVPDPWVPARDGGVCKIHVHPNGKPAYEEVIQEPEGIYAIEADTVARHVDQRQAPSPAMSWDDSLGNMRTLDAWRAQIGLTYEQEKLQNMTEPAARRPLKLGTKIGAAEKSGSAGKSGGAGESGGAGKSGSAGRSGTPATRYGRIPGIDKPVSRIAVGADFSGGAPREALAIFDDAFERGVNMFDTAFIYGNGASDAVLGHWVNSRGVRDQVVIIGKGAHTPHCNPKDLTAQLHKSLDSAKLDFADLYIMHRDNPDIPVGEFVDVLNEHRNAGLLRAFGGSNWSIRRVQDANDYAARKGLTPMAVVSNNFSLARMVEAIWDGCAAASDAESRAWFTKTQTVLIPWSSQARGFFTDRVHRDKSLNDEEMNRCWVSDDNWRRRERVCELAGKKNVLPINIALAYVLCQPFPTFPLIGPRQISETRTSLPALDVKLTADELKWLNLET